MYYLYVVVQLLFFTVSCHFKQKQKKVEIKKRKMRKCPKIKRYKRGLPSSGKSHQGKKEREQKNRMG